MIAAIALKSARLCKSCFQFLFFCARKKPKMSAKKSGEGETSSGLSLECTDKELRYDSCLLQNEFPYVKVFTTKRAFQGFFHF